MSAPACRPALLARAVACAMLALVPNAARTQSTDPAPAAEPPANAPAIEQNIPMRTPIQPVAPVIDPRQVPPPSPLAPNETLPVPDRWRLVDQLKILQPRWYDPYNANPIKGDRPI